MSRILVAAFAAALLAQLAAAPRALRVGLWAYLGLTSLATVYFGWHYVVDDLAGMAIGVLALAGACLLCGYDPRRAAREPAPS